MDVRCPLCDGDVFTEYDCEMVCVVCHISMGHISADGGSRINFGSEQNDMSCTTVSGLLPDLSGNLKIEGFGNICVKRMYKWKYVQYLEKMIIQFYTKTMNNITMYEFKSSFDRLGIKYEKGWTLDSYETEDQRFSNDGALPYVFWDPNHLEYISGSTYTVVPAWVMEHGFRKIVCEAMDIKIPFGEHYYIPDCLKQEIIQSLYDQKKNRIFVHRTRVV
jgi:hypothetical protein